MGVLQLITGPAHTTVELELLEGPRGRGGRGGARSVKRVVLQRSPAMMPSVECASTVCISIRAHC